jgi:hypothetical protein
LDPASPEAHPGGQAWPLSKPDWQFAARQYPMCDAVGLSGELDQGPMKQRFSSFASPDDGQPFCVRSQVVFFALQHLSRTSGAGAAARGHDLKSQKTIEELQRDVHFLGETVCARPVQPSSWSISRAVQPDRLLAAFSAGQPAGPWL